MSERFRRLDALIAGNTDGETKAFLLELRGRWEAESLEIEINYDKRAKEDAEIARLRAGIEARDGWMQEHCAQATERAGYLAIPCIKCGAPLCPKNAHPLDAKEGGQ